MITSRHGICFRITDTVSRNSRSWLGSLSNGRVSNEELRYVVLVSLHKLLEQMVSGNFRRLNAHVMTLLWPSSLCRCVVYCISIEFLAPWQLTQISSNSHNPISNTFWCRQINITTMFCCKKTGRISMTRRTIQARSILHQCVYL